MKGGPTFYYPNLCSICTEDYICVRWKTEVFLLSYMYFMTGKGISLQNVGLIESRLIVYSLEQGKTVDFFSRALNREQFYVVFLTFTSYFDFFPSTSNFNDNINVFSFETLIFFTVQFTYRIKLSIQHIRPGCFQICVFESCT